MARTQISRSMSRASELFNLQGNANCIRLKVKHTYLILRSAVLALLVVEKDKPDTSDQNFKAFSNTSSCFERDKSAPYSTKYVKCLLFHLPDVLYLFTRPCLPTGSGIPQRGAFICASVSSSNLPVTGRPVNSWKFLMATTKSWFPARVGDKY